MGEQQTIPGPSCTPAHHLLAWEHNYDICLLGYRGCRLKTEERDRDGSIPAGHAGLGRALVGNTPIATDKVNQLLQLMICYRRQQGSCCRQKGRPWDVLRSQHRRRWKLA